MFLPLMEPADILRRLTQRLQKAGIHSLSGGGELRRRHPEVLQFRAVKAPRITPQGRVAPGPDLPENVVHSGGDVLFRPDIPVQKFLRGKAVEIQDFHHVSVTSASLPSNVSISRRLN